MPLLYMMAFLQAVGNLRRKYCLRFFCLCLVETMIPQGGSALLRRVYSRICVSVSKLRRASNNWQYTYIEDTVYRGNMEKKGILNSDLFD